MLVRLSFMSAPRALRREPALRRNRGIWPRRWLGRRLSRRWGQKREEKERAQRLAQETRQQRRARERRQKK